MPKSRTLPRAVILGGYVNGLGLVRSLARIGVRSIVVDNYRSIAGASRWAEQAYCPSPLHDETTFLQTLKEIGAAQKEKPVIFATNDEWLFPILKEKAALTPFFRFPMSDWELVNRCLDKEKLYRMAESHHIPQPRSVFPRSAQELRQPLPLSFPIIVKPVVTVGFAETLGSIGRSVLVKDRAQLLSLADSFEAAGLGDRALIVQEFVSGGVESLYTFTSYSNQSGEVLAWSTGHKIRQQPPAAGAITSGRVVPCPELAQIGRAFIRAIGFHGIANTEFKRDAISGEFKLIEINARPGMWNRSALETGINLPAMAYREALGETLPYVGSNDNQIVWVMSLLDAYNTIIKHRLANKDYSLSPWKWWQTLAGKKIDAIASFRDPLPFFRYCLNLARTVHVKKNKLWA